MITRPGFPRIPHIRPVAALLMAAAALALPACQSALSPNNGQAESDAFYQSLVAREIARGTYGERALADGTAPTTIGGLRELNRVDSAGPQSNPADGYPRPTVNPTLDSVAFIGRDAATLHMAEPTTKLSLQEAIARTVGHSLAIKVEAYNPAIAEAKLIQTQAHAYDPTLFGGTQFSINDDPSVATPNFSNGTSWNNNIGVKQVLPIGTTIQASAAANLRDVNLAGIPSSALISAPSPISSWSSNINLQLTQPLLRGFGEAVNSSDIYLAQRDLRISQSAFRQQVMNVVGKVEEAYWNLIEQRTNLDVQEHLVVASEQTYAEVYARIPIDATSASVYQARSALLSRRVALLQAQHDYRAASDTLKTLMNDPDLDIESNVLIDPSDRPVTAAPSYDLLDCIETALRQRPEMQQARLDLEKDDINMTVAKNSTLPKLDLTLALQTNGLDRGIDQSLMQNINPANQIDYTIGLKFEIPLGNREADALVDQRNNERRQAIDHMIDIAKQQVANVRANLRDVYSNYDSLDLADQQRIAAAAEFNGILEIEDIRPHTPEFLQLKLDSQARLAQAEQQLIQSIVNYNIAIEKLEQSRGTLLEYDRISLDKVPRPQPSRPLNILNSPAPTRLDK